MTSNSSQNLSSCSTGGSDPAVGGGWLGFSLSPRMAATMDGSNAVQVQQQHHGGLFYPPVVSASPAGFWYALGGGGQDDVSTAGANGGGGFYPGLSAMPLKSDGSLCIMEALHRSSEQDHHGKLVPLMALFTLVGKNERSLVLARAYLLQFVLAPLMALDWFLKSCFVL
jgi:AP2-like factor (ANT lineage)